MVPTTNNIRLWCLVALLALAASFLPSLSLSWKIVAAISAGVVTFDFLLTFVTPNLSVQRSVHHNLPVGSWSKGMLKISNHGVFRYHVEIWDHYHKTFKVRHIPQSIAVEPGGTGTIQYRFYPLSRGHYSFKGTDLFVKSPLHLWQKKYHYPCIDEVKVFPNFKENSHFSLLATHHHLSQLGVRKLTRRGEGNEFHQLREFRQGDDLQKVDWKATSRYRRLISREYQDERDQQIVFILDSGRRMSHADGSGSQLDRALNSILLLSYVASRQGDCVGLYSFGGTEKWLPPKKQENSVRSLLLGMYDIESSTNAADYYRATQDLMTCQNRRSLMVLITNSRAEDHDDIIHLARRLRRKHLVVIVDLKEELLPKELQSPVSDLNDALRFQSLQHYMTKRKQLLTQLSHLGVITLGVTAKELPASLVNCYLDIKSAGNL